MHQTQAIGHLAASPPGSIIPPQPPRNRPVSPIPAPDKTDRNTLLEAQVATLDATNAWLQQTFPGSGLQLELIARRTARPLAQAFNAPDIERLVDWDWEQLFFHKIQHQKTMWMFGITVRGRYGAACLGTINITSDYVSIEYLERHPQVHELSRLTALIAIQYIQALAAYLDMDTVRISAPDPLLLDYYERTFGFIRHEEAGAVRYLFKTIPS